MLFNYTILFAAIITTVAAVAAQLLLKHGMSSMGDITFSFRAMFELGIYTFKNIYIFSGLFLLGVSFIVWIWLLSKIQLNIIYPVTASAQLALIVMASYFILRESLSLVQIAGVFVIMLGIFLLAYKI